MNKETAEDIMNIKFPQGKSYWRTRNWYHVRAQRWGRNIRDDEDMIFEIRMELRRLATALKLVTYMPEKTSEMWREGLKLARQMEFLLIALDAAHLRIRE